MFRPKSNSFVINLAGWSSRASSLLHSTSFVETTNLVAPTAVRPSPEMQKLVQRKLKEMELGMQMGKSTNDALASAAAKNEPLAKEVDAV